MYVLLEFDVSLIVPYPLLYVSCTASADILQCTAWSCLPAFVVLRCRCTNALIVKRSDLQIHSLFRWCFVYVKFLSALVSILLKVKMCYQISLSPAQCIGNFLYVIYALSTTWTSKEHPWWKPLNWQYRFIIIFWCEAVFGYSDFLRTGY